MSKIEITSSNIDKFVKRFHKVTDAKNNGKKLSESQEIFAKSLGSQNYNELKTLLDHENAQVTTKTRLTSKNELYKGWTIENSETMAIGEFLTAFHKVELSKSTKMSKAELFYNQFLTLINYPKSKISSCVFKKDEFEYSILLKTCYGDEFSYVFGKAGRNIELILGERGFSIIDVSLMSTIFSKKIANDLNLLNRFDAIDFANDLYEYLVKLRGEKSLYTLKFNQNESVNNSYIFENDSLYEVCKTFISDNYYIALSDLTKDRNESNFLKVTNIGFFNQMIDSIGGNLIIYYKNLDESNDYIIKKENFPKLP